MATASRRTLNRARRFFCARGAPHDQRRTIPVTTNSQQQRFLTRAEVCDMIGVSYVSLWTWMRAVKFPRGRMISEGRVGWLETDINKWIADRPVQKLKGDNRRGGKAA